MNIYVASSWTNPHHNRIVGLLRAAGHRVFDYRNPSEGDNGFRWDQVGLNMGKRTDSVGFEEFLKALGHPRANTSFHKDAGGVVACDLLVLLLPSGNSAHLEAGVACGMGKKVIVFVNDGEDIRPDLMYSWCEVVKGDINLLAAINGTVHAYKTRDFR